MANWKQFQFIDRHLVDFAPPVFSVRTIYIIKGVGRGRVGWRRGQQPHLSVHGEIAMVNRALQVGQFTAHQQGRITRMLGMDQWKTLVTLAEEDDAAPLIKFWDLAPVNNILTDDPLLHRSLRLQHVESRYPVTSLAVLDDFSQVAVGFADGKVILIRGAQLATDRAHRQKVLYTSQDPVTGLSFRRKGRSSLLYMATTAKVMICDTTIVNKETFVVLDENGAALNTVAVRTGTPDSDLIIARQEAIYFYTTDGRGACFAFDGKKSDMFWFSTYVVFLTPVVHPQPSSGRKGQGDSGAVMYVTFFDPELKLIAYADMIVGPLRAKFSVWGGLFILSGDGKLWRFEEQETDDKLGALYRLNLYPLAVQLAKRAGRDERSTYVILRRYGDYLYGKADYDGAMAQYRKTIGYLEPSYVIRKFLDAQRIRHLTAYLQDVHANRLATAEHTTLLVNCYTKLGDSDKLEEFIQSEADTMTFDIETAIRVCKQAGYHRLAVKLAQKSGDHAMYLKIQVEDARDYVDAIRYIEQLKPAQIDLYLEKYANVLMKHLPEETIGLLIDLCTGALPRPPKEDVASPPQPSTMLHNFSSLAFQRTPTLHAARIPPPPPQPADQYDAPSPQKYQRVFFNNLDGLIRFYEGVASKRWNNIASDDPIVEEEKKHVYGTLLELYLCKDELNQSDTVPTTIRHGKALTLLKEQAGLDAGQALILCEQAEFYDGVVLLHEMQQSYEEILRLRMKQGNVQAAMECLRKYGTKEPHLYSIVLNWLAREPARLFWHHAALSELLDRIDQDNMLPPLKVLNELGRTDVTTIALVRNYVTQRIQAERESQEHDEEAIKAYRTEAEKKRRELYELQNEMRVFQTSKCASCDHDLEGNVLHFLCRHSYHQRCLGEEDAECPKCLPERLQVSETRRMQHMQADKHAYFFSQVPCSHNPKRYSSRTPTMALM